MIFQIFFLMIKSLVETMGDKIEVGFAKSEEDSETKEKERENISKDNENQSTQTEQTQMSFTLPATSNYYQPSSSPCPRYNI
jgi:hypothetical protein